MNWVCPRCGGTVDRARRECESCGYVLDVLFYRRSVSRRLAEWALRRETASLRRDGYELRSASVEWVETADDIGTDEALLAGCLFGWLGGRIALRLAHTGGSLRAEFRPAATTEPADSPR